jgi:hypothetical protein
MSNQLDWLLAEQRKHYDAILDGVRQRVACSRMSVEQQREYIDHVRADLDSDLRRFAAEVRAMFGTERSTEALH